MTEKRWTLSFYPLCPRHQKPKKNTKAKAKDDSHLEEKSEHYNFKNLDIGVEFDSDWENGLKYQLYKYKLCVEITMDQK